MKILVCSFENRVNDPLYKVVNDNHKRYCEHNDYEYVEINDFSKYHVRNHDVWHKFDVIKEVFEKHEFDYMLYVDGMDTLFTNFNKRIEDFIVDESEIFLSKDDKGGRCKWDYGWNIGVILFKKTDRVKHFVDMMTTDWLYDLFSTLSMTRIVHFLEQSAMEWAFENLEEWKGLVKEIPAKSFNSYIPQRAYVGNAWSQRRSNIAFSRDDKSAKNNGH